MTEIVDIAGREILDSRGNPTVEVDVTLEDGSFGRAAVPSGASTGAHEAVEKRDGDKGRYGGKGVLQAVDAVNGEIFDALVGFDALDQVRLDHTLIELDGTPNKCRLGANAILGVSLAAAKAAAMASELELYRYVGGVSARVLPDPDDEHHQRRGACRQSDRHPGVHGPAHRRAELRRGAAHGRGDLPCAAQGAEGRRPQHQRRRRGRLRAQPGLGATTRSPSSSRPARRPATRPATTSCWASTWPSTEFFKDGKYELEGEGKTPRSRRHGRLPRRPGRRLPHRLHRGRLCRGRLRRLEAAHRPAGRRRSSSSATTCSSPTRERLGDGIKQGLANSILVKVNQIGTLTETLDAVNMAQRAGYTVVMSHRSGETEDSTIADLAVATNCGQIKTGSLARSDRTAKYNQLLRIEEHARRPGGLRRSGGAEAGLAERQANIPHLQRGQRASTTSGQPVQLDPGSPSRPWMTVVS